jgi:CBS domain-containing protein
MAEDRRTHDDGGKDAGARRQGATSNAIRDFAETARRGAVAGAEASRGAAEGAAQQADHVARQLTEAAGVYEGVARRIAEEMRAFAGAPAAAASGAQDLSRAWAEWLQSAVQTGAHFSQDVMRARSLPEVARVHARFVEESLAGLREGGARVLEAAGGLAERALEPLQEDAAGEDEGEDEGPLAVADVMTRNVRVASPEDSAQEAAAVMARADAGALPVGEQDRIVGMLTDRDLAVRVVAAGKDPAKTKVREAMSPGVEYCFEGEEVGAVAEKMAELKVRRLPVLNHEKRLVGIVSLGDLAADQPDAGVAGRALGGIAREGGPHRQRLVRPKKAQAARQRQQQRRR